MRELTIGELYAFIDKTYASPLFTGYYLGCLSAPIPTQSYRDDCETGLYYVFGTSPNKTLNGKYNHRVLEANLGKVYKLVEV